MITIFTQIPLILRTMNAFIPVSYGWFGTWAHLSKDLTPYRDYFVPFPILGLWIEGSLPNLFSHYVFAEQVVAGLMWTALICGQFLLATLIWKPKHAAIGTIFAAYFFFALPVLKLATYYEVMLLCLVYGTYFVALGLKRERLSDLYLFLGGAFLAAAPFIKQTAVIPSVAICFFVTYRLTRAGNRSRQISPLMCGYALIPAVIFAIAIKQGFLLSMIDCMLTGGGKNPTIAQSLNWGIAQPITAAGWWPWIVFVAWVIFRERPVPAIGRNQAIYSALIALTFLGIASPQSIYIGTNGNELLGIILGVIVITSIISITLSMKSEMDLHEKSVFSQTLNTLSFLLLFGIIFPTIGFLVSSAIRDDVSSLAPTISAQMGLGGVVFTGLLLLGSFSSSNEERQAENGSVRRFFIPKQSRLAGQIVSIFLLTLAASNSMVAGFTAEAWAVAVGLLISYVASCLDTDLRKSSSIFLVSGLLLPFILLFAVRIVSEPYFWWALRTPPIEAKRYSIPIESLAGFRVSNEDREIWIRLQKSVSGDESAKIFAGPNIGGVPFMIGREPAFNNCAIIWWDVCPETLALEDLEWLKGNPPKYIIWSHQPTGVIYGHEEAFRSGKISAVSIMQSWIDSQLSAGSYTLIDTIQLTPDNPILVLKLV